MGHPRSPGLEENPLESTAQSPHPAFHPHRDSEEGKYLTLIKGTKAQAWSWTQAGKLPAQLHVRVAATDV